MSGTATPAATSSNLSVAVGPVSIPAEVDRPEIVVSTGPNQVQLDEFNRWASPLQNNIARVISENLVAMLGTPRVTLFPQALSADADYRVAIEVQSFRSAPGEATVLDAVWTVRRAQDGRTETRRTSVREAVQEGAATMRSPPLTAARSHASAGTSPTPCVRSIVPGSRRSRCDLRSSRSAPRLLSE
ncbi:MAG: PqiC family protein [Chromatiales bacterium]